MAEENKDTETWTIRLTFEYPKHMVSAGKLTEVALSWAQSNKINEAARCVRIEVDKSDY